MNHSNPLDEIPDHLIQAYLVHAAEVIYHLELSDFSKIEAYEPYGWNQNVLYLTKAEQKFRSVHSPVVQDMHSRSIPPEDLSINLIDRAKSIFEERYAMANTIDEIVTLVNNQERLELLTEMTTSGHFKLYSVLTTLGSKLESFRNLVSSNY